MLVLQSQGNLRRQDNVRRIHGKMRSVNAPAFQREPPRDGIQLSAVTPDFPSERMLPPGEMHRCLPLHQERLRHRKGTAARVRSYLHGKMQGCKLFV